MAEGETLCKRHLAVERKRKEKNAAFESEWEADKAWQRRVAELAEEHGIAFMRVYSMGRYQHDRVSVPLDDLLRLLGKGSSDA